eukprot:Pgem_evm1s8442
MTHNKFCKAFDGSKHCCLTGSSCGKTNKAVPDPCCDHEQIVNVTSINSIKYDLANQKFDLQKDYNTKDNMDATVKMIAYFRNNAAQATRGASLSFSGTTSQTLDFGRG